MQTSLANNNWWWFSDSLYVFQCHNKKFLFASGCRERLSEKIATSTTLLQKWVMTKHFREMRNDQIFDGCEQWTMIVWTIIVLDAKLKQHWNEARKSETVILLVVRLPPDLRPGNVGVNSQKRKQERSYKNEQLNIFKCKLDSAKSFQELQSMCTASIGKFEQYFIYFLSGQMFSREKTLQANVWFRKVIKLFFDEEITIV